jgi:hypothetical protein
MVFGGQGAQNGERKAQNGDFFIKFFCKKKVSYSVSGGVECQD